MASVQKSVLVPYSAEQMFALVAAIEEALTDAQAPVSTPQVGG